MKIKLNSNTSIDLEKLVLSKLLIQANSGGGKSWAIRRLLEQSHGKVQQIIIDPEGEFASLREKYEYILCGKGQDAPAEPRSAALLAQRLLEFKTSAIIDLYELHPQERKHFVRLFLEAMVNAPKELWHPVLVVIDEAHTFAPEKGESEALNAVIGLASLGRKRQFGAVLATQRISKLHKDTAAECNNKMIGRTGLDIDRKRAAEEIGFTSKEDVLSLRNLTPGEFYCFGPAISDEVIKEKVGEVHTSHAIVGRKAAKVAPPTEKIKNILGKLADLPKEAAQEAKTISELKTEIVALKRANKTIPKVSDVPMGVSQWMEYGRKYGYADFFEKKIQTGFLKKLEPAQKLLANMEKIFQDAAKLASSPKPFFTTSKIVVSSEEIKPSKILIGVDPAHGKDKAAVVTMRQNELGTLDVVDVEYGIMGQGERKVLQAVASYPSGMTREHITVQTAYKRSTRDAYIQRLAAKGYVTIGSKIQATSEGVEALGTDYKPLPTGDDLIEYYKKELPEGEAKILTWLLDHPDEVVSRDQISEELSEMKRSTRDAYIQRLAARQLIEVSREGVRVSPFLLV